MVTTGRSFKILGVQQIAIGALDKKVLSDFWVGKLGVEKVSEYRAEVSDRNNVKVSGNPQELCVFHGLYGYRKRMLMKIF